VINRGQGNNLDGRLYQEKGPHQVQALRQELVPQEAPQVRQLRLPGGKNP